MTTKVIVFVTVIISVLGRYHDGQYYSSPYSVSGKIPTSCDQDRRDLKWCVERSLREQNAYFDKNAIQGCFRGGGSTCQPPNLNSPYERFQQCMDNGLRPLYASCLFSKVSFPLADDFEDPAEFIGNYGEFADQRNHYYGPHYNGHRSKRDNHNWNGGRYNDRWDDNNNGRYNNNGNKFHGGGYGGYPEYDDDFVTNLLKTSIECGVGNCVLPLIPVNIASNPDEWTVAICRARDKCPKPTDGKCLTEMRLFQMAECECSREIDIDLVATNCRTSSGYSGNYDEPSNNGHGLSCSMIVSEQPSDFVLDVIGDINCNGLGFNYS